MIAFKEWSLVCQALGNGTQSLILRKGGIAEGRAGFQWKHDAFILFPTHFHEQNQHIRGAAAMPIPEADLENHTVSLVGKIEWKGTLTNWDTIQALEPYHQWTDETIQDRFDYTGERALSVALLRIYRMPAPVTFPDARGYGGCRSWVEIPVSVDEATLIPVLTDAEHQARVAALLPLLES